MEDQKRAYLELHTAVFLFGFTAILGDLIHLSAFMIVWWRVVLSSLFILLFRSAIRNIPQIERKRIYQFLGIGIVLAIHWLCFYGSVKYANASIAVITLATCAFFTSFLEPIFLRRKVLILEVIMAALMVPSVVLVVANLNWQLMTGFYVGLISAFFLSLFATLNKKYISAANPMTITFLELLSSSVILTIALPFYFQMDPVAKFIAINLMDWLYMIFLVVFCTIGGQYLSLKSLHHLSAFTNSFVVNLEPVYGVFLAMVILHDHRELSQYFYLGVILIIILILSYPFLKRIYYPPIETQIK